MQKISRRAVTLCGPRRFLKIDCLLNEPTPVFYKLAPSESECESKIVFPRLKQKRCCTENTAARPLEQKRLGYIRNLTGPLGLLDRPHTVPKHAGSYRGPTLWKSGGRYSPR